MGYIDREQALSHPFANGKYDHDNANEHFILGFEGYREWLNGFPVTPAEEYDWTWTDEATYGHPYGAYVCVCGNVMSHKTPYCPSCGRKMKV